MAYQVLARKWRPQNFTQLVGQEHVSRSLCNALQNDRLHHAYLFTGTRGVGKTTIARILAKAINCENLKDSNPCEKCQVCLAFEEGRFLDLIEVDAASRTKVEDTRDLLDNAQYVPHQGKYKVYLIDEVHMLSGHSFNALLKTLEEPPPHVKFLLATTDPQKIPLTVLSRCLQFNLKQLLPKQIEEQMEYILNQEHIDAEATALKLLARSADGSMRDGLSLLDQAIAFGNGEVRLETVTNMLGTVAQQAIDEILLALADNNAAGVLQKIAESAELTPDFSDILQQILRVLHRVTLAQTIPGFIDNNFDSDIIDQLREKLLPEDVQLFYQIGLIGQRDLDLAPDPRCGFEMLMLRMLSFKPETVTTHIDAQQLDIEKPKKLGFKQTASINTDTAVKAEKIILKSTENINWSEMITAMKIRGNTRELANNCVLESMDNEVCVLILDPGHTQLGRLPEERLQKALQNYCGKSIKLVINIKKIDHQTPAQQISKDQETRQQAAVESIATDENIQALKDQFGARVLPGTIKPLIDTDS